MGIKRLHFEDLGQDFTWWDYDEETGEIVDCGPFQARLWANGKTFLATSSIEIGVQPVVFLPAGDPEGVTLNYAVERIDDRPDPHADPFNPQGSDPAPIVPREG